MSFPSIRKGINNGDLEPHTLDLEKLRSLCCCFTLKDTITLDSWRHNQSQQGRIPRKVCPNSTVNLLEHVFYKKRCLTFRSDIPPNKKTLPSLGCFRKWWYPQIIHFDRVFHYKPSILGYHHFWKHPLKAHTGKHTSSKTARLNL